MKAPEKPTGHSPLGASGAYRWMACPGSVGLSRGLSDPESEYAAEGTAAHTLAAECLKRDCDAWTFLGCQVAPNGDIYSPDKFEDMTQAGIVVTQEMTDAVQVYLEYVRSAFPDRNQGNFFVERPFHCPTLHPAYYGTTDAAYVFDGGIGSGLMTLEIVDYKHGAGIVVDADENPQLMYYAAGMLEDLKLWQAVSRVRMTIVQPRGFHFDGPIRTWEIATDDLWSWVEHVLVPAMKHAEVSRDTKSGEHCRFCPVRFKACPQILTDLTELEALIVSMNMDAAGKPARDLTNEEAARVLSLLEIAKIAGKAANEQIFHRLEAGQKVPGFKLAAARTNRTFKEGAEAEAKKAFGDNAYNPKALKSPAEIDKLPLGKDFTKRWAYKPEGKLTVVPTDDARPAVTAKSLFEPVTAPKRSGK